MRPLPSIFFSRAESRSRPLMGREIHRWLVGCVAYSSMNLRQSESVWTLPLSSPCAFQLGVSMT